MRDIITLLQQFLFVVSPIWKCIPTNVKKRCWTSVNALIPKARHHHRRPQNKHLRLLDDD